MCDYLLFSISYFTESAQFSTIVSCTLEIHSFAEFDFSLLVSKSNIW